MPLVLEHELTEGLRGPAAAQSAAHAATPRPSASLSVCGEATITPGSRQDSPPNTIRQPVGVDGLICGPVGRIALGRLDAATRALLAVQGRGSSTSTSRSAPREDRSPTTPLRPEHSID